MATEIEPNKNIEPNELKNSENDKFKDFRENTEQRFNKKFEKKETGYLEEIQNLKKEIEFTNNTKPRIQKAFIEAGGKTEFFNDFMKINQNNINPEQIDKSIEELSQKTQWAFDGNQNSTIQEQLKSGTNIKPKNNDNDYYAGTLYKKIK